MNGYERTIKFIKGEATDYIPFQPLVMQYAAQKTNTKFGAYCLEPLAQCDCMLGFSKAFGLDSTHPSGFAYCEAGAYGLQVTYPEDNLPWAKTHLILDFERDINLIKPLEIEKNKAMMNRVEGVRLYKEKSNGEVFITGHCEGPLAEYCDLRGVSDAFMDLYDYPDEIIQALQIIVNNTKTWIKLQAEAGCHCMSIGDAVCSQISEDMYVEFILPLHKQLTEYIHSLGIYAKFHICGDTRRVIPHLAKIGVNIIDVDHLVTNIEDFVPLLGENQVFWGNIDPVSVIKNGTPEDIRNAVKTLIDKTNRKCIIAAGCEIPKDTPEENYKAFLQAVKDYS